MRDANRKHNRSSGRALTKLAINLTAIAVCFGLGLVAAGSFSGLAKQCPNALRVSVSEQPGGLGLRSPGQLAAGYRGDGEEDAISVLFVSDSGHHRIAEIAVSEGGVLAKATPGEVLSWIGSGKEGFRDGTFETAQFRRPQGIFFSPPYLFVADAGNHSLRRADLRTRTVETIAGGGAPGTTDGALAASQFNEPGDIVRIGERLYVSDTGNRAIRVVEKGSVKTLATKESAATALETGDDKDR